MKKSSVKNQKIFLDEIIEDIDEFIDGKKERVPAGDPNMPGVMSLLQVRTKNIVLFVEGMLTRIPFKIIRRGTHPYYLYQKSANYHFDRRIKRLEERLIKLANEVEGEKDDK